jgi:hypothetical protein
VNLWLFSTTEKLFCFRPIIPASSSSGWSAAGSSTSSANLPPRSMSRCKEKGGTFHALFVHCFASIFARIAMCALLFSNSTNPGCGYLDHAEPAMKQFLLGVRRFSLLWSPALIFAYSPTYPHGRIAAFCSSHLPARIATYITQKPRHASTQWGSNAILCICLKTPAPP